jgi:hypothetical protein
LVAFKPPKSISNLLKKLNIGSIIKYRRLYVKFIPCLKHLIIFFEFKIKDSKSKDEAFSLYPPFRKLITFIKASTFLRLFEGIYREV